MQVLKLIAWIGGWAVRWDTTGELRKGQWLVWWNIKRQLAFEQRQMTQIRLAANEKNLKQKTITNRFPHCSANSMRHRQWYIFWASNVESLRMTGVCVKTVMRWLSCNKWHRHSSSLTLPAICQKHSYKQSPLQVPKKCFSIRHARWVEYQTGKYAIPVSGDISSWPSTSGSSEEHGSVQPCLTKRAYRWRYPLGIVLTNWKHVYQMTADRVSAVYTTLMRFPKIITRWVSRQKNPQI